MLEQNDSQEFRTWVRGLLDQGQVTVVFDRSDGTQRTMRCTTRPDLLPARVAEGVQREPRRVNPDVMPVYDLDLQAWRSFRWDRVREVRFEI